MQSLRRLQHIDRHDLYTDLEARVQYLHSFLDFSSNDIEALVIGSKYIKALIPAVVNIVYKKLLQYDITAQAFTTRSTSYKGTVDEYPDENSPQILYRKLFLRGYLQKLCSDPSKMEFWEYLDKVGMMHTGQGRKHPLHVEYIHIGACLGMISDVMTEAILSHPRLKLDRKIAIVKAINKVLWIQNDLFAKWYVRDGDEYRVEAAANAPEIEKEGFLHGKKMLKTEESEMSDARTGVSASEAESDVLTPREGERVGSGMMGRKKEDIPPVPPSPEGGNETNGMPSACPFAALGAGVKNMDLKDLPSIPTSHPHIQQ